MLATSSLGWCPVSHAQAARGLPGTELAHLRPGPSDGWVEAAVRQCLDRTGQGGLVLAQCAKQRRVRGNGACGMPRRVTRRVMAAKAEARRGPARRRPRAGRRQERQSLGARLGVPGSTARCLGTSAADAADRRLPADLHPPSPSSPSWRWGRYRAHTGGRWRCGPQIRACRPPPGRQPRRADRWPVVPSRPGARPNHRRAASLPDVTAPQFIPSLAVMRWSAALCGSAADAEDRACPADGRGRRHPARVFFLDISHVLRHAHREHRRHVSRIGRSPRTRRSSARLEFGTRPDRQQVEWQHVEGCIDGITDLVVPGGSPGGERLGSAWLDRLDQPQLVAPDFALGDDNDGEPKNFAIRIDINAPFPRFPVFQWHE